MGEHNTHGEHNTPGEQNSPQLSRRGAAVVVPLLGMIAVLVGVVVAWNGRDDPIGWFAYAPLSNQAFTASGGSFVSHGTLTGLAAAMVGLLVLAFWAGIRVGRRR